MTSAVRSVLSPALCCIIYASSIECPPVRMPRQLKLTLDSDDSQRIAAAAGDVPALIEMLRAYFNDILSEEERSTDERKDHSES